MTKTNEVEKIDHRKELTDKIIKELEKGVVPWEKPWDKGMIPPFNPISGTQYKGGNFLSLLMKGHDDPRWMTFNQAKEEGYSVKKGEKATYIEFWLFHDEVPKKDEKGKVLKDENGYTIKEKVEREFPLCRRFAVFNANQIEGISPLDLETTKHNWNPIEKAEEILKKSGAMIKHDQSNRAFYSPNSDEIHLPKKEAFSTDEKYYGTALHELAHWTGHESRLNRLSHKAPFGSPEYAKEELRAELASFFLGTETGIKPNIGQHAAYIEGWLKALKNDPNEIFKAANEASKIATYLQSENIGKNKEIEKKENKVDLKFEVTKEKKDNNLSFGR